MRRAFVATVLLGIPVYAQSPADGPWSGSIQCSLDMEQPGYSRHEIQTWTLTGEAATIQGAMRVYPATWTVTGQGALQRPQGARAANAQWNVSVPPANAPLAMFIRASDGRFIIRQWHSLKTMSNGVVGTRQAVLNGAAAQPSAVNLAASEWQLPWIETSPDANLSGTLSVQAESLGGDLAQGGSPAAAVCKWQFARGAAAVVDIKQRTESIPSTNTQTASTAVTAAQGAKLGALRPAGSSPPPMQVAPQATTIPSIDNSQTIDSGTQASATAPPAPSFDRNSLPVDRKMPIQRAAPAGFTARDLGSGTVQFTWGPVNGANGYHFEGTGIAASGLYAGAHATGFTINDVPPGPGTWKMAADYGNNSWDPNLTATASAMVRYTPSHAVPWLSKKNGPGNSAAALAHYRSLCPTCSLGDTFQKVATTLGLTVGSDAYTAPTAVSDSSALSVFEARYTNVTDFGIARATICLPLPVERTLCYSKSSDQKLSVIVMQAQLGVTWFLTFTAPSPSADIFNYHLSDQVTLDSEGQKFAPHACLACHGGQYDTPTGLVMGSTFLPLDPGLLQVSDTGGRNGINILAVNQIIMGSGPSIAVARYLTGLYGADPRTFSLLGGTTQQALWGIPDFAPRGWASQAGLYRQVIKPHCVMCHLASSSSVDFSSADSFFGGKAQVYAAVCSARSMPHAELPFKNFWTKDTGPIFMPGLLAAALGYQSCP
jgi:hypothetical protein